MCMFFSAPCVDMVSTTNSDVYNKDTVASILLLEEEVCFFF